MTACLDSINMTDSLSRDMHKKMGSSVYVDLMFASFLTREIAVYTIRRHCIIGSIGIIR